MEYRKKRISNTPVLQYSNDMKQCQIELLRTKGYLNRNQIIFDTTDAGNIRIAEKEVQLMEQRKGGL